MRIHVILIIFLTVSVLIAGPENNSLVYGELYAPNTLWPYFTEDPVTLRMIDLYLRPLIYNFSDAYQAPRDYIEVLIDPVTPESINWSRTPNLVLTIKKNLRWSNGRALTADDVIATFDLITSGEVNTVYKFVYDVIYNISGNGRRISIDFNFPSKNLLSALNFFVLPKEVASNPEAYAKLVNDTQRIKSHCNGPFVPEKVSKTGEGYSFRRNPYAPEPPYLDRVTLKVLPDTNALIDNLLAGEVDMIADIPPSIVTTRIAQAKQKGKSAVKLTAIYYAENRFYFVMLNYRKEFFHDKKFRIDLMKALDREELSYAFGLATEKITGPLIPGSVWSNPAVKPWEHDPNVDLSKYNSKFVESLVLIHPAFPEYRKLAAGIITQWKRAGLTRIKRKEYKPDEFWKKLEDGDFDMALFEFTAAKSFVTLYPLIACDGVMNYAAYNCPDTYMNTEISNLLDKVEGVEAFSIPSEKRLEYYQKLHKLLHDTEPHLWLFTVQRSIFYNSKLNIPYISPSRPFKSVEKWSWAR